MKIVFDGLILSDGADTAPDGSGVTWMVTEMTGWDSPPLRLTSVDYSMRHGSAPAIPTYGPRAVALTGVVTAPDLSAFWNAYNLFLGKTSTLSTPTTLVCTEDTIDKTLWVIRGAEPRFVIRPSHFTFDVPLTAPDPLKYGAAATTTLAAAASGSIVNDGNEPTSYLTVTLTSGGTLGLTIGGTRLYGSATMASGTVIDVRRRTVYLGAQNRYYQLDPTSQWVSLVPGSNAVTNSGTASLSIAYRPAWV